MAYTETNEVGAERQTRSVPQLMRDFLGEVTALLRDEVNLARGEITQNIERLRSGLMILGAGALVALAGLVVLLDAVVLGLMPYVPSDALWIAPLIVGGVVVAIGVGMLMNGRSKVEADTITPDRAIHQVHRDQQMLKERLS